MKIQFDNNELLDVTRSPYCSEERLVMYIANGQVPAERVISEAKAADNVYFYVNDEVLATYHGYTSFNSLTITDTEINVVMINPNPEHEDESSDYVEAVRILLGDESTPVDHGSEDLV